MITALALANLAVLALDFYLARKGGLEGFLKFYYNTSRLVYLEKAYRRARN